MEAWAQKYPKITVEQDFTANASTHTTSLKAQLAGGTPPDVAQVEYQWSVDFALDGLFLPLDDHMRRARVSADEFFPGGVEYLRLNNKYYAFPITGHGPLLYYNRDLFQKANVPPPPTAHTWKWADLLTTAQRLTRRVAGSPQESQWGLMASYGLPYLTASAIWQNKGAMTDARENPSRTTLDAKAQEAIQWLVDLRYRHQAIPTAEEERALGGQPFVLGKVAMWWAPSFVTYTALAPVKNFWWDISFVPRGPDGTAAAGTATNHISILRGAKNPDAAWTLAYFFAAEEGARLRAQIQNIPPGHKRVFEEVWMKAEPPVRRQVLKETHPFAKDLWKGRGFGDWQAEVNKILGAPWNGKTSVAAAVQEAVQQGTRIIQENRRA
ncbi:MAG: extracellular solute-binding protein [Chloroflexi bacterium]|nr:extracellular solute-binding protein [Chloroflexota bacterium]